MTEFSSWSSLQEPKFDFVPQSDLKYVPKGDHKRLSLNKNKFNKWSKFKRGFEKTSFADKLYRSKSKSRRHDTKCEEQQRRPRYEYSSNSVAEYHPDSSPVSYYYEGKITDVQRRQRKRGIQAEVEDIPAVAEGDLLNNRCKFFINNSEHVLISILDEVLNKLGEGGFSLVVKCHDRNSHSDVAVKLQRTKYKEDAKYEIETLELIKEEKKYYPNDPCNAIYLVDHFVFKDSICMVFPLYRCSLLDLIKDRALSGRIVPLFTLEEIRHFSRQLLQTVECK
jgi:hypothetical protein